MSHLSFHGRYGLLSLCLCVGLSKNVEAAQLQLWSSPQGATITENETGKTYRTPIWINYTLGPKDSNGCSVVKGWSATWKSGAHIESPQVISLCGPGPTWNYKFERPAVPRQDIDFAYESELARQQKQLANQQQGGELVQAGILGFLSGYFGGRSSTYVPPPITDVGRTGPMDTGTSQSASPPAQALPQLAPNGTYVSGNGPVTLCPNGQYVAGNCVLTPNGTYVGGP